MLYERDLLRLARCLRDARNGQYLLDECRILRFVFLECCDRVLRGAASKKAKRVSDLWNEMRTALKAVKERKEREDEEKMRK